jgi:UDP-N-acetylmuramate--alanine ligase
MSLYKEICFLGIGGAGMSALARYFHQNGVRVFGYDKTPTALTAKLVEEGMNVFYDDDPALYPPQPDLVVYTPAIPQDLKGLSFYKSKGIRVEKRAVILAEVCRKGKTIAVAGSHGKTTVSGMIAHVLRTAGIPCTAILGGSMLNYNSNFIHGNDEVFVVEADEFDRSFLHLKPWLSVVTSVDTDHLDVYGSRDKIQEAFLEFIHNTDPYGFLLIKQAQLPEEKLPQIDKAFYAFDDADADVYCSRYWTPDGAYLFYINYFGETLRQFRLGIGGLHNLENALAAMAVAREMGVDNNRIREGLQSFKGIHRRFEKVADNGNTLCIDDYAHHPEEIRALIRSVKDLWPGRKITALFQPHLFSRTRDLAEGFAEALSLADEVVLLDIYPARELPIEGVTSDLIGNKIRRPTKRLSLSEAREWVPTEANKQDILLTIGAGDIDTLIPLIKNTVV